VVCTPRHLGRLALAVALLAGLAGQASADAADPLDPLYADAVQTASAPHGWLARLDWDWLTLQRAATSERAFPTIAVVDSGVDVDHPEFAGNLDMIEADSRDCSTGRALTPGPGMRRLDDLDTDAPGHGTTVAGLAAAPANGDGMVGASPFSSLLVERIAPRGLGGLDCALAQVGRALAGRGLLVVNLSLDYGATPTGPARTRAAAIARIVRAGGLVVAAAGNRDPLVHARVAYPAALLHTLTVGDSEGVAAVRLTPPDLLAPGGGVSFPDVATGEWRTREQPTTSWATALASGAAAALWGAHPEAVDGAGLTAQQVAWLLRRGASNSGRYRTSTGFGVISLERSMALVAPADDEIEPNDRGADLGAAGAQLTLACPGSRCGLEVHGLLARNDDEVDVWKVRTDRPVCARVRATSGRVARVPRVARAGGAVFVTVRRGSTPLAAYTLTIDVGRRC